MQTPETNEAVEAYFTNNPTASQREAARDLNITLYAVQRTLKKSLHWYPYRPKRVTVLSAEHERKRKDASNFLRLKPDAWFDNIIFSDEKWWFRRMAPNRQNDRVYAPKGMDPHETVECREQGGEKIMCWAGCVDGKVLQIRWMIDGNNDHISMTGPVYAEEIIRPVWQEVRREAGHYYWQQDGARAHTTNANLELLQQLFPDRVISDRLETAWPPRSPDLTPIDFWFWPRVEAVVRRQNPETLEDLMAAVEAVAHDLDPDEIRRSCRSVKRRAQACWEADGGHFDFAL